MHKHHPFFSLNICFSFYASLAFVPCLVCVCVCVRGFCFVLDICICCADTCVCVCVWERSWVCIYVANIRTENGRWLRSRFYGVWVDNFCTRRALVCASSRTSRFNHISLGGDKAMKKIEKKFEYICELVRSSFNIILGYVDALTTYYMAMHIMKFKCAMSNVFGSVRNAHTVQCSVFAVRPLSIRVA